MIGWGCLFNWQNWVLGELGQEGYFTPSFFVLRFGLNMIEWLLIQPADIDDSTITHSYIMCGTIDYNSIQLPTTRSKPRPTKKPLSNFLSLKLESNKLTRKAAILADLQGRMMRAGGWTLTKACVLCSRSGRGLNLGEYTRGWLPRVIQIHIYRCIV